MSRLMIGEVRFSYANVWEPKAAEGSNDEKYSVALLIPKSDKATIAKVEAAIKSAQDEGKSKLWAGKLPKNLWNPLRDGDDKENDPEGVYEGCMYLNAKSNNAPGVLDENKEEILIKTDFYSGCYGQALVSFYPFNKNSNGVGVGLVAVRKLRDGEALGGGGFSADEFEDEDL